MKEHYTNFHCGITGEKLKPFKENDTAKKIKGFGVNWFKVKKLQSLLNDKRNTVPVQFSFRKLTEMKSFKAF